MVIEICKSKGVARRDSVFRRHPRRAQLPEEILPDGHRTPPGGKAQELQIDGLGWGAGGLRGALGGSQIAFSRVDRRTPSTESQVRSRGVDQKFLNPPPKWNLLQKIAPADM
jgi:hypothetical protein